MDNKISQLQLLIYWFQYEWNCGNKIKAAKIHQAFCMMAMRKYPGLNIDTIARRYNEYDW